MVKIDFTSPEFRKEFTEPEAAEDFLAEFVAVVPYDCQVTVTVEAGKIIVVIDPSEGSVMLASPLLAMSVVDIMREMGFTVMVTETLDPTLN